MKSFVIAAMLSAVSTMSFAGAYAGAEYSTGEISVEGLSADVTGARVYVGAEGDVTESVTVYGEVGFTSGEASAYGYSVDATGTDYKVGVSYSFSDSTSIYGEYQNNDYGVEGVNLGQDSTNCRHSL